METIRGNTLEYWKQNAEENYITTPISVLKYITILEETLIGSKIKQLIATCGTKDKVIEVLQKCTTAENIDKMTDAELVGLWFQRWEMG